MFLYAAAVPGTYTIHNLLLLLQLFIIIVRITYGRVLTIPAPQHGLVILLGTTETKSVIRLAKTDLALNEVVQRWPRLSPPSKRSYKNKRGGRANQRMQVISLSPSSLYCYISTYRYILSSFCCR